MDQNEKKNIKKEINESWSKIKQFCIDHKEGIETAAVSILSFIGIMKTKNSNSISTSSDSNNVFSYDRLRRLSYDELDEIRENVRMNTQGTRRDTLLNRIDRVLSEATNPRAEFARSLPNDELQSSLESAKKKYYEGYEKYEHDKRSYAELYQDEDYKKYQKDYDLFNQLRIEKERRYAKEHPDKFPIHREHGWYLPEDDD